MGKPVRTYQFLKRKVDQVIIQDPRRAVYGGGLCAFGDREPPMASHEPTIRYDSSTIGYPLINHESVAHESVAHEPTPNQPLIHHPASPPVVLAGQVLAKATAEGEMQMVH